MPDKKKQGGMVALGGRGVLTTTVPPVCDMSDLHEAAERLGIPQMLQALRNAKAEENEAKAHARGVEQE